MNDAARQALADIVQTYGPEKYLDARRLENLLKDLAPGHRAEIHVLLCALKVGVPEELTSGPAHDATPDSPDASLDAQLTRLVRRVSDDFALDEEAAGWAVESWGLSLNIIPVEQIGAREWGAMRYAEAEEGEVAEGEDDGQGEVIDLTRYLVVSQTGRDQFTTINEALEAAEDGQRILIRPGVYRESIMLTKQVDLIGDGPAEAVIIESINSDGVIMQAESATLRNLTVRALARSIEVSRYAVNIPHGRLGVFDCRLASSGNAAIGITGQTAVPSFSHCRIGDGPGRGIVIWDLGRATFTDCEIFGFGGNCVEVVSWASPTFLRCRIHSGSASGVSVYDNGVGTFTECEIFDFPLAAVTITRGGNPTFDRCHIHHARAHGVFIHEKGEGTIRRCNLRNNSRGGVFVEGGCRAKLSENQVD